LLVGARQDRYGNVKEYASLFYVVWGTNDNTGANVVKEIYISDILFSYLKGFSQEEVKQFFRTVITHERLEMIAISGKSKRYNSHHKDFPRTSDGFHKYIKKGLDFGEFIREEGLPESDVESQRNLLETLDKMIAEVNEDNSEYSGIISLVSMEGNSYLDEDIERFLSVRSGDDKVISQSVLDLADEICKKLKQEYDLSHPEGFDISEFVKFVNDNYTFVYKKSNAYMHFSNLPFVVKDLIRDKYIKEWSQSGTANDSSINTIFLPIYGIDEETLSLEQESEIKGKNVFFVEDIISRNSRTYNRIFKKLRDSEVAKVQPFVFFDLSKEPRGKDVMTEDTYKKILKNPQLLFKTISNTNGKVKKYVVYWLVNLLKDSDGIKVLQQLSEQDKDVIRNLVNELFSILEKGETIINVKNTEIVELILFFGLGEKRDINNLTKQDLDDIIKKYNVKPNSDEAKPLSVKYDEWKDNIPYLIMYSYLCGYRYIDASGINNIYETVEGSKESNKYLIEKFCEKFNISLIDKKTKLKYFHSFDREIGTVESLIDEEIAERIENFIDDYKSSKIKSDEEISDIIDDELQQLVDNFGATKSERIKLKKEADVLKCK
ncbi:MAG: hypothetical protein II417_03325, partial [Elusimicrobia bacterium]|nr:hypothetical protein [Elusimicrobiota bacterium]